MKRKIYLDSAATTPVKEEVMKYVFSIIKTDFYNPSSSYEYAHNVNEIIEKTTLSICNEINANPGEIIFTSGSSESNALAITGWCKANHKDCFTTTRLEHPSILLNNIPKYYISCDKQGIVDICSQPENSLYLSGLVSICMANSEIGTIQDIKKISEKVHRAGGVLHVDGTQALGKIPIDVKGMGIDMMSASAHKIGGLKGCGFLYVKEGIKISPIIFGTQQNGLRGGTFNVPGIAGLGKAIELIDYKDGIEVKEKRDWLINELCNIEGVHLNGSRDNRLPNNVNILIDNLKITSGALVSLLDCQGFMVSAGSACSSYSPMPSTTLMAIGLTPEQAKKSIRITLSEDTTYEDLKSFVECLKMIINFQ